MRYVLLTRFPDGPNDQWQLYTVSDDREGLLGVKRHAEKNGMIACVLDTETSL